MSVVSRVFSDATIRRPPSMLMGIERATFQLRSEETVQIKLAKAQPVKARTDKLKSFGKIGRVSCLVIKTNRQTRTTKLNRTTIPFVA